MLAHRLHDGSELFTTHDAYPGIGPHPKEARRVCPATHTVVSSTVASTDNDGELWDISAGNGCDELGAVLCDAFTLGSGADHEAGNVLEEDQGDAALGAEFDKVSALLAGGGEKNAVVGDDADFVAVDAGEACDESGAVVAFELGEVRAIDDAGDDFTDGKGLAQVSGCDAEELFRVVERLGEGWSGAGGGWPVEVANGAASEGDGVGVVNGEVVCDAGDRRVHLAAAEVLR